MNNTPARPGSAPSVKQPAQAVTSEQAQVTTVQPSSGTHNAGTRSESRASPRGPDVTVEEAYAILGLAPGADAEAIRAAHRRLMKQLHPDHGGTDYLATKINRARDVLLNR